MLKSKNVPKEFWAEAGNTACHVVNRVSIRRGAFQKTPFELWKGSAVEKRLLEADRGSDVDNLMKHSGCVVTERFRQGKGGFRERIDLRFIIR
jgi:hypothetical protein